MPNNAINATAFALGHRMYTGQTWHVRHLPSVHKFSYPYRMWGLWLSQLDEVDNSRWFTVADTQKAQSKAQHKTHSFSLNQFLVKDHDHLFTKSNNADADHPQSHADFLAAIKTRLLELTGAPVTGDILAVTNARTLGFYFSPVNFFIGFDAAAKPSHLLAEVSNTPWGETHLYGFLLTGTHTHYSHDKAFKVSPFNDVAGEQYHWQVNVTTDKLRITISLIDARGKVFDAGITLAPTPLTRTHVRREILKNPIMNITSIARIYWQAFKLYFLKKIPFIPYNKPNS